MATNKELVEALNCALQYYDMFRDESPKGPTEIDDIETCRKLAATTATQDEGPTGAHPFFPGLSEWS